MEEPAEEESKGCGIDSVSELDCVRVGGAWQAKVDKMCCTERASKERWRSITYSS